MESKNNQISIEIKNLTKTYSNKKKEQKKIFDKINIKFEKGKVHCILGISGCGKSTIMKMIAGLESYDSGEIIFEEDIKEIDKQISMVLQDNNLLPWYTVYQNFEFVLKSANYDGNINKIINIVLEKYELTKYSNFYPYELSVGLKQKISLAKSLICNPTIILLDEPFCALDFISKTNIHEIFIKNFKLKKFTSILATHFIEEAVILGDYIHIFGGKKDYIKLKNLNKKKKFSTEKMIDIIKQEYI